MRRSILFFCLLGTAFAARNPQLESVHTVYLLPMGNSLDQYLATRLTQTGMFQVVTDPQKADAVFTDKIGQGFEDKMTELYPPPEVKTEDKKIKIKIKIKTWTLWESPASDLDPSPGVTGLCFW